MGQKSVLKMEENPWVQPISEQYLLGISHVLEYIKSDAYKMYVETALIERRVNIFFFIFLACITDIVTLSNQVYHQKQIKARRHHVKGLKLWIELQYYP